MVSLPDPLSGSMFLVNLDGEPSLHLLFIELVSAVLSPGMMDLARFFAPGSLLS